MSDPKPSFFTRLSIALRALINSLSDPAFAIAAQDLNRRAESARSQHAAITTTPVLEATNPESALQLLGLLQRDGRLIDFLEEDVAQYSDADIGAAVRVVHEGCRQVLKEHFVIAPVVDSPEGASLTLEPGFDASSIRPTGNVVGEPPFKGVVTHRGWRAKEIKLPKLATGHDATVLAAAEVEL